MPDSTPDRPHRDAVTAFLVGACDIQVWGMSGSERAERVVRRAGVDDIAIGGYHLDRGHTALLVRTDMVVDEALVLALLEQPDTLLVSDDAIAPVPVAAHVGGALLDAASKVLRAQDPDLDSAVAAGLKLTTPARLAGSYNAALRKRAVPLVARIADDSVAAIERATFAASYKGVTDFVTKWVWPRPAFVVTRFLARRGVTPNTVTAASLVCVIAALLAFMNGAYLTGIAFGWLMAFLDTVDGKLARVTLTSSKWGNVFDHGIDLIAPPLWWLAWWWGLETRDSETMTTAMLIVVGGYVAGKLLEQAFISTFGLKIHMWRPLDSTFRQITARRNPNLAILTVGAVLGAPAAGYLAVAVWTVICLTFHMVRFAMALVQRSGSGGVRSWLDA